MYHSRGNLCFGRTKDGEIRIVKMIPGTVIDVDKIEAGNRDIENVILDQVIPVEMFASAVCEVSVGEESESRYKQILEFLKGKEITKKEMPRRGVEIKDKDIERAFLQYIEVALIEFEQPHRKSEYDILEVYKRAFTKVVIGLLTGKNKEKGED